MQSIQSRFAALAAILAVGAHAPAAAEQVTTELIDTVSLSVSQFQTSWQPLPDYGYIRTWYDGTGYQMAMSDTTPHNSVGWLESPVFNVPAADTTGEGNISVMTVNFDFTPNYTGTAPEMRVRFHTADFIQYATASITSNRFSALRTTGSGQLQIVFDRRTFTQPRAMRCYVDLISATTSGNADPLFYFRIKDITIRSYSPATESSELDSRVNASFLETDGDVCVYVGDSTARKRIYRAADGYAASGSYAIALDGGNLYAFDGPNAFVEVRVTDSGQAISAAVSGQHVVWVEDDDELRYFNIRTGETFRIERDKDFLGVVPMGNGSFVAICTDSSNSSGRRFYAYDTNRTSPALRRLDDDDAGYYVNAGATGVVSTKRSSAEKQTDYQLISGNWMFAE
ncbi:hypothetical protein GC173_14010 [bacterium]|nr:hypothetical protein [bacterium]